MRAMYVLVGEQEGDYGDYYERYRETVAAAYDPELLENYKRHIPPDEHDFVAFCIEEVPLIETMPLPEEMLKDWAEKE